MLKAVASVLHHERKELAIQRFGVGVEEQFSDSCEISRPRK